MNCLSADVEDNAYILQNKHIQNEKRVQLSDFIFWSGSHLGSIWI